MAKLLILSGIAIVAVGVLWFFLEKFGFGHLPGDIAIRGKSFSIHFPIVTCIILSFFLTLLMWLVRWFTSRG